MRRAFVRLLLLGALVAIGLSLWRRWRGPWPIQPQPEWPSPPDPGAGAEAPAAAPEQAWVTPAGDGECPDGFPVKANQSGIYHVPGGRFYERTRPERCYASPEAAERDGYRRAKA